MMQRAKTLFGALLHNITSILWYEYLIKLIPIIIATSWKWMKLRDVFMCNKCVYDTTNGCHGSAHYLLNNLYNLWWHHYHGITSFHTHTHTDIHSQSERDSKMQQNMNNKHSPFIEATIVKVTPANIIIRPCKYIQNFILILKWMLCAVWYAVTSEYQQKMIELVLIIASSDSNKYFTCTSKITIAPVYWNKLKFCFAYLQAV